jgi:arabinose-5-phosphate isomerase
MTAKNEMSAAPAAPDNKSDLAFGRNVVQSEGSYLEKLAEGLASDFMAAVELLISMSGRVVVSGMGKAGLIGKKIAHTLASTGTPAFFLHPAEALHGDLGMVLEGDVMLVLTNSGETEELLRMLPHVTQRVKIIAITRNRQTSVGRQADIVLELGEITEACPLGLAPSVSTTAMLALGDAVALTVERRRGFSDEDFARFHPSGALGKRFQTVTEIMRRDHRCPIVHESQTVAETINTITRARAGSAVVTDSDGCLLGIFTDGDFRRNWRIDPEIGGKEVRGFMTSPCVHVHDIELVTDARKLMSQRHINEVPVVDAEGKVVGLLDIQDIV